MILRSLLFAASVIATPVSAQTGLPDGWDGARLLALVDADMAATAYANGKLFPIEGARDQLVLIDGASAARSQVAQPVSNTVMGWPGSLVTSQDGLFAYVVSSRGEIDRATEEMDSVFNDMPVASTMTTVDLRTGGVVSATEPCLKPMSVDLAPARDWLLVACGDAEGELAVVPLTEGVPGTPRRFDLDVPDYADRAIDGGATYAVVHPGGEGAGVVLNNRAVALVRFSLDDEGVPVSAAAETPTPTERWLSVARWTASGDHLLVADVAWGPRPLDAAFNRDGEIVSFALSPDKTARGIVSTARVSKSPEAFEMNRAGDLLAVVNMERTYLPGGIPTGLFRHRSASSLSLVRVDAATGAVTTVGNPVRFKGVLPEDAVFDADGDRIAVVVYQDHDQPRSDGWITFFRVDGEGDDLRAVETGDRIPLPRGGHDLVPMD